MTMDDTLWLASSDSADLSSAHLQALDMPEFPEVRQPVKPPQVGLPASVPGPAQRPQPRFEPCAESRRIAAGTPVKRFPAGSKTGVNARAPEQQRMQFGRKTMRVALFSR